MGLAGGSKLKTSSINTMHGNQNGNHNSNHNQFGPNGLDAPREEFDTPNLDTSGLNSLHSKGNSQNFDEFGQPKALSQLDELEKTVEVGLPFQDSLGIAQIIGKADAVGKSVLLILLLCSLWSWAVIISKFLKLRYLFYTQNEFETQFRSGGSLENVYEKVSRINNHPLVPIFALGLREIDKNYSPHKNTVHFVDRIEKTMELAFDRDVVKIEAGVASLASIASSAPFIGLLAMVWSLLNAFKTMASVANPTTNMLAPSLVEALFATAVGLFVAIPASLGYNKIMGDINLYVGRVGALIKEMSLLIYKQLDSIESKNYESKHY